jgi:hypothetical protein
VVIMMIAVVITQEPQNVAAVTAFLEWHRRMKQLQSTLNSNASFGTTTAQSSHRSQTHKLPATVPWPSHWLYSTIEYCPVHDQKIFYFKMLLPWALRSKKVCYSWMVAYSMCKQREKSQ